MTQLFGGTSPAYGALFDELRSFLDALTLASPRDPLAVELSADLRGWSERLELAPVPRDRRVYGRSLGLTGHGQALTPAYELWEDGVGGWAGPAPFGTHFLGGGDAAHGGSLPLLFDEVFAWSANGGGRRPSRTAYLHVDFSSAVRLNRRLDLALRVESSEGRKHLLRGELRDGDTVCAQAEAVFVELRDGQPQPSIKRLLDFCAGRIYAARGLGAEPSAPSTTCLGWGTAWSWTWRVVSRS